ncbi:MAG: hypothetical protein ACKKL5_03645 [Candidatus Komeilibacteria bacterium]
MRQSKFLLLFFAFALLLFLPQGSNAAWSDPTCAPPGCNRPQPITVEGGTIQSGSLNLSNGVPLQAGDISVDDSGITVGAKLVPNGGLSGYDDKYLVCSWDSGAEQLVCTEESLGKTAHTLANDLLVATNNILLTNDGILNMTGGNNRIYIAEGGEGVGGYGLYSQAHSIAKEVESIESYNSAVHGKSADTTTAAKFVSYGVIGQALAGSNSIGVYGTAPAAGFGVYGYNSGGASATGYAGYYYGNFKVKLPRSGGLGNAFIVQSDWGSGVVPQVITIEPSSTSGTDNIFFDGDVYIGGDTRGTHQICLNDSGNGQNCVSSWDEVSGQGTGNAVFKTVDVPTGTDPVADNAADILTVSGDTNILVYGNASIDSIGISLNSSLSNIVAVNGEIDDYLYLNGDDKFGVQVYDALLVDGNVTVNGLSANCDKVTTDGNKILTCGTDAVDDADSSSTNEIQGLGDVTKIDSMTKDDITTGSITINSATGQLCIGTTCMTESDLIDLLKLLK